MLENYGSVLRDCSTAISLNPKSSKAFYRSASALVALERYDEALDCCTKCLAFDPDNKGMEAIRQKTQSLKDAKEKKERERRDKLRREQEEKRLLQIAFKVGGQLSMLGIIC